MCVCYIYAGFLIYAWIMPFLEASYKKNKNKTTNNKTTTYICKDFTHIYVILKLFAVVCIVQPTCKIIKKVVDYYIPSFHLLFVCGERKLLSFKNGSYFEDIIRLHYFRAFLLQFIFPGTKLICWCMSPEISYKVSQYEWHL